MSFNTAPKLLSVGKILVVSFVVLFGASYAQGTTSNYQADLTACISDGETHDACKKKIEADEETKRVAEDERSKKKEAKNKCGDAIKDFTTARNELGSLCTKAKVSSNSLTCHQELEYCTDADTCKYEERAGLTDKLSEYNDKNEALLDINDKINDAKERISGLQQQMAEVESERDKNLQNIRNASQDTFDDATKALRELGEASELAISQSTNQAEQINESLQALREDGTQELYQQYNDQVNQLTDECEQEAIDKLNALRQRLYDTRKSKRVNQSSLQEGDQEDALGSRYIRACLQRTQRRQASLLSQRDRALRQNQRQIESTERQLGVLEESIQRINERTLTDSQQLTLDTNKALSRFSIQENEVSRDALINITSLQQQIEQENQKLGLQASQNPFIKPQGSSGTSLYGQLAAAEAELQKAGVKLDKAQKADAPTFEQEDIRDLFTAKGTADAVSREVLNSCDCTPSGDTYTSEHLTAREAKETCGVAKKYETPDTKAVAKRARKSRSATTGTSN